MQRLRFVLAIVGAAALSCATPEARRSTAVSFIVAGAAIAAYSGTGIAYAKVKGFDPAAETAAVSMVPAGVFLIAGLIVLANAAEPPEDRAPREEDPCGCKKKHPPGRFRAECRATCNPEAAPIWP